MKKKRMVRAALTAAALLALSTAGATGCIRQTDVPIVAEKQPSGADTGTSAETSTKQGQSPSQDSAGAKDLTDRLAEAPDRYKAAIAEEHVRIEADAPIEIPSITRVPTIEIENAPYTEADRDSVLDLLKEETGVEEWIPNTSTMNIGGHEIPADSWVALEDKDNPGKSEYFLIEKLDFASSYNSSDGNYNFSFTKGSNPDRTPMMWLTNRTYSDGNILQDDAANLSDFSTTGTARESLEKELKTKAEDLLERLSLSDFYLKTAQWKKIVSTENGHVEFTGKYGLRLTYVRSFEGIPTVNRGAGWASAVMAPSQYVEFLYHEDGTLLRMKDINRERVTANLGYEDFLLPFDAIAQIFEQYMKYYQTVYSFTDWSAYSGMAVSPSIAPEPKPNLSVTVTEVRFGYQLTYDSWDAQTLSRGSGKGHLVPVWAFYGTPKAGYWQGSDSSADSMLIPQASEDGLLLTVNAVDGTVYGKE